MAKVMGMTVIRILSSPPHNNSTVCIMYIIDQY